MTGRRLLPIAAALAAVALVAEPATAAGLPVQVPGEAEGITVVAPTGQTRLHFGPTAAAKKAYRRIAGKKVEVGCGRVERIDGGRYDTTGQTEGTLRAPRRRGSLWMTTSGDFCFVSLPATKRSSRQIVAMAPATPAGREYLEELNATGLMFAMLLVSSDVTSDAEPAPTAPTAPLSAEEVARRTHGLAVLLPGPDASPPPGKVGLWLSAERYVLVAVTSTGRRLFHDMDRDVLRTNVSHLLD